MEVMTYRVVREIIELDRKLLFEWGGEFKSKLAAHNYATYRLNQVGGIWYVIEVIEKIEE